jgi:hypothetical protein
MKKAGFFLLLLGGTTVLFAKDFWEKPFAEWKHSEVVKMLEDSPWSDKVVITDQRAGRNTRNVAGEMEIYYSYTVRLFSAFPVRAGYVRMFQLMNKYDDLSREEKAAFDQKFAPALRDFPDQIIVNLDFETNDRQASMEVDRRLKQLTTDQIKQSVFLISDSLGRVEVLQYFPPSPDGTGAKFSFPREVDGKPVVQETDKELKFELYVPGTGHKVYQVWKVKDLSYDGKPAV